MACKINSILGMKGRKAKLKWGGKARGKRRRKNMRKVMVLKK